LDRKKPVCYNPWLAKMPSHRQVVWAAVFAKELSKAPTVLAANAESLFSVRSIEFPCVCSCVTTKNAALDCSYCHGTGTTIKVINV
jgi:hypothetical protein